MAGKKDFSSVNVNPVFDAITAATEPLPGQLEITAAGSVQEVTTEPRKDRKGYTDAEKKQFLTTMKTAGHKGCKLPRINLAFAPDVYDYCHTMARASGITITEFCNKVLRQNMADNMEVYEKAIEFRNSL